MLTGTAGLLQLLSSGNSRGTAVLVDLRDVPYAENPLFRQSIVDLLDRFAAQFQPEVVEVGRYAQAFMFQETNAHPFVNKLKAVVADFADQHVAAPRVSIYHLPNDDNRFAAHLRRVAPQGEEQAPAVPALSPVEQQQLAGVHKLAVYEQVLSGADVSALVRESPVWRRQDDGYWELEFSEVTVAVDHLERAVGTPLRRDPWLLQQIAPILDRRTIRHFQYEPSRLHTPHSMNLQWQTVVSTDFQEFVCDLTYDQRRNLIVEISATAPDLTEAGLSDAIDVLRLWDCRVAIDHLSLRHADAGYLPLSALDYLKIDTGGIVVDAQGAAPPLPDWMVRFGAARVVAINPRDDALVDALVAQGIRLIERRDRPAPPPPRLPAAPPVSSIW